MTFAETITDQLTAKRHYLSLEEVMQFVVNVAILVEEERLRHVFRYLEDEWMRRFTWVAVLARKVDYHFIPLPDRVFQLQVLIIS